MSTSSYHPEPQHVAENPMPEDGDDDNDALLEQMLWKAERLACAIKLQKASSSGHSSSGSSDPNALFSVPNSIELNQPQEDCGITECSSVGYLLSAEKPVVEEEKKVDFEDSHRHIGTLTGSTIPETNEVDGSQPQGAEAPTSPTRKLMDEASKSKDEDSNDQKDVSSNLSAKRIDHSAMARSEGEIMAAIKAAREMKVQLEAVLFESSESGGSEGNMESSTSEDDNDGEQEDHSFNDETEASSMLEALTPVRKKHVALNLPENPATRLPVIQRKVATKKLEIGVDDMVPVADYTGPTPRDSREKKSLESNTRGVIFEKVEIATEGDQDYAPIRDYSMSPKKRETALRELSYSDKRAALIHKRRVRRRQRRLAVLGVFFVAAVGFLVSRRYSVVPPNSSSSQKDVVKAQAREQTKSSSTAPAQTIVVPEMAEKVVEKVNDVPKFSTEVVGNANGVPKSSTPPIQGEVNKADNCLFPFAHLFSPVCSNKAQLLHGNEASVRERRRKMLENLLQSMMQ